MKKISKNEKLTNFKKANSSLERIMMMIEEDEYCIDIMQQNLAVIGLLKSANQQLMENHLDTCFKKAVESKQKGRQRKMIDEILRVTDLANR